MSARRWWLIVGVAYPIVASAIFAAAATLTFSVMGLFGGSELVVNVVSSVLVLGLVYFAARFMRDRGADRRLWIVAAIWTAVSFLLTLVAAIVIMGGQLPGGLESALYTAYYPAVGSLAMWLGLRGVPSRRSPRAASSVPDDPSDQGPW